MSISAIPTDVLVQFVAPHLDPVSACRASQTCRKMNEAFSSDRVWTDYSGQYNLHVDQKNANGEQVPVKQLFEKAVQCNQESFEGLLGRVGGRDVKKQITIRFLQHPETEVMITKWKTRHYSHKKMVQETVYLKESLGSAQEKKSEQLQGLSSKRGLSCYVHQFPEGEKLKEYRQIYKDYWIPCSGG